MLGRPYNHVESQSPLSNMVNVMIQTLQIGYLGDKWSDGYKVPDK